MIARENAYNEPRLRRFTFQPDLALFQSETLDEIWPKQQKLGRPWWLDWLPPTPTSNNEPDDRTKPKQPRR